jgi:UTP--glucose-1-phosphate uridylyltransferase
MKNQKIRIAILPVAGMGTRFLPATKAQPKEMLPIVDTPVIQFLVEEAVQSGIEQIIFVTGKGKRAIEDHFDSSLELENLLIQKGKKDIAAQLHAISNLAQFAYVRQKEPRGDGDALLSAFHLVGNEPVAVLFGDNLVFSEEPCLAQMMKVFEEYGEPTVALEHVPDEKVSLYGIVEGEEIKQRTHRISRVVEKPKPTQTTSRLAAMGKYIITPEIFDRLRGLKPDQGGEVRLANAFQAHLEKGGELYGLEFKGKHFDCGSKLGFLEATVEHGLQHPETKREFAAYLKERMGCGE